MWMWRMESSKTGEEAEPNFWRCEPRAADFLEEQPGALIFLEGPTLASGARGDQVSIQPRFRNGDGQGNCVLILSIFLSPPKPRTGVAAPPPHPPSAIAARSSHALRHIMSRHARGGGPPAARRGLSAYAAASSPAGAFHEHYARIYGPRWPSLYAAMRLPTRHVARVNKFFLETVQREGEGATAAAAVSSLSQLATPPKGSGGVDGGEIVELERLMRRCALAEAAGEEAAGEDKREGEWARILRVADPGSPLCFFLGGERGQQGFAPPTEARARWVGGSVGEEEEGSVVSGASSADADESDSASDSGSSSVARAPLLSTHPQQQHRAPLPYYIMDLASILAALALDVKEGHTVADFCAAPGGKSLVLAELLGPTGKLVANDRSKARSARLARTLGDYIPAFAALRPGAAAAAETPVGVKGPAVQVTCQDAAKWFGAAQHRQSYDRILVDAPCGSERHLIQQEEEAAASGGANRRKEEAGLREWAPGRTKNIANDQRALLSSALRCLKPTPGARVVYSTCSISPLENDAVVAKLLKRNPEFTVLGEEEVLGCETRLGRFLEACQEGGLLGGLEKSECGWWVLPDANGGWGPIFFSVLERRAGGGGDGGDGDREEEGGEGANRKYRRPKPERPGRRGPR